MSDIAIRYRQLFGAAGLTGVELPYESGEGRHIYNQFVIRLAPRDSLMAHLKARQIGHEVYYPLSMHQQACFANLGHPPAPSRKVKRRRWRRWRSQSTRN